MFHSPPFFLGCFEGPLELLLFLIQKDEVDLYEISLKMLTSQAMDLLEKERIEIAADVLALASTFLLMKSQRLLPDDAVVFDEGSSEKPIEMIQKLIEYCRFKDAAQALSKQEELQHSFFPRGAETFRKELGTGLEEVDLSDLKNLLLGAIQKSQKKAHKSIQEEVWQVETKIAWFHEELQSQVKIFFSELFSDEKSKEELICIFLALLELMKRQTLKVVRENDMLYIIHHDKAT